ncbi:MAG TPA: MFS transporter [Flavisolibacter sp.]|nr:MFS transporter [Flavisolibacter sp.]
MSQLTITSTPTNKVYRVAVSGLFFLQGLCFATWASRIPSIQQALNLSDAALGAVLFALPVGSMLSLPFSGRLVNRFGSKRIAVNALLLYSVFLILLGLSNSIVLLLISLVGFGMAGNISNIAINTQAIGVEARYEKPIMASFHGLWSLAGFLAAGIGTYMMGNSVTPLYHFVLVGGIIALGVALTVSHLLTEEAPVSTEKKKFALPDKSLMILGAIGFCCMICEGAMFDWSGIYFQNVVQANKEWVGAGYTAFMCTMATGRFIADWGSARLGFKRTIQLSGLLIATGLGIAIIFPFLLSSILGFLLVGFGVSSVVPLVYSEAGKSKTMSAGSALTAVTSISFLGFLIGPPVIGMIAGVSSLRFSFMVIALIGLTVVFIAGKARRD